MKALTPEDFCNWLKGFIAESITNHYTPLAGEVVELIDHRLAQVFTTKQKQQEKKTLPKPTKRPSAWRNSEKRIMC